jgi:hypothetical protein
MSSAPVISDTEDDGFGLDSISELIGIDIEKKALALIA